MGNKNVFNFYFLFMFISILKKKIRYLTKFVNPTNKILPSRR